VALGIVCRRSCRYLALESCKSSTAQRNRYAVQIYEGSISAFAAKKNGALTTFLSLPVWPSMRTVDSAYATVRTRFSIFIRSVPHLNIPSNSCCLGRSRLAKPMLKKLCASGKAIFDRPLLASYAVAAIRSDDIPRISGTLCPPLAGVWNRLRHANNPRWSVRWPDGWSEAVLVLSGGPIPILLGCRSVFSISEARCASSRIAVHQRTRHQVRSLPNWHREWLASVEPVDRRRATKQPTAQQW
jgi:hypothetical protein